VAGPPPAALGRRGSLDDGGPPGGTGIDDDLDVPARRVPGHHIPVRRRGSTAPAAGLQVHGACAYYPEFREARYVAGRTQLPESWPPLRPAPETASLREPDTLTRNGRRCAEVRFCLLALVAPFLCSAPALAWQVRLPGEGPGAGAALAGAVAANGDVIAGGYLDADGTGPAFTVVRLVGADGAERWRRTLLPGSGAYGSAPDGVSALELDAAGAVVAAGTTSLPGSGARFTVVRLNGTTGSLVWRYDASADSGRALAMAVDDAGDVVAAGVVSATPPGSGVMFTVVKLMGDTGQPLWTRNLEPGLRAPNAAAVVVRPDQDVVASGYTTKPVSGSASLVVMRLDRATGAERWRTPLGGGCAPHLAVSPDSDVFASAGFCEDARLDAVPTPPTRRLSGETGEEV
jgi:PQQ-like domain